MASELNPQKRPTDSEPTIATTDLRPDSPPPDLPTQVSTGAWQPSTPPEGATGTWQVGPSSEGATGAWQAEPDNTEGTAEVGTPKTEAAIIGTIDDPSRPAGPESRSEDSP